MKLDPDFLPLRWKLTARPGTAGRRPSWVHRPHVHTRVHGKWVRATVPASDGCASESFLTQSAKQPPLAYQFDIQAAMYPWPRDPWNGRGTWPGCHLNVPLWNPMWKRDNLYSINCVTKKPIKAHIISEQILSNIKEQNFNKGVALNLSWQELIIKVQ